MSELNIALAAVGGLLLVLGLFTSLINHVSFLSEPLLALVAGVLIGPAAFDLLDLASSGNQEMSCSRRRFSRWALPSWGRPYACP